MGGVRHEILTHVFEAHLPRHIAHEQQVLAFAIRHELHRKVVIELDVGLQDDRVRVVPAIEVAGEIGLANQVVDA